MQTPSSINLLWRYLTFVWLFDDVPPSAPATLQRAAIVRSNRERGLRFLPVYMARYLRMLVALDHAGTASDVMAVAADLRRLLHPVDDGAGGAADREHRVHGDAVPGVRPRPLVAQTGCRSAAWLVRA